MGAGGTKRETSPQAPLALVPPQGGRGTMQTHNLLIEENIEILKRGIELLKDLDDQIYPEVKHPFSAHGIGSHFRHCVDFYHSFVSGIEEGRIDYDDRERDSRTGRDRRTAIEKIEAIINRLEELSGIDNQMPLMVRLEDSGEEADPSSWSWSSVMRELQSLVSHTVHHYALIGLMMQLNGFTIPEDFGVAPSTLKQWRNTAPCAR